MSKKCDYKSIDRITSLFENEFNKKEDEKERER